MAKGGERKGRQASSAGNVRGANSLDYIRFTSKHVSPKLVCIIYEVQ